MHDSHTKFSHITISLHWLIALTIIALLAVGIYMEENEVYFLYPIHKSIGILILGFVIVRVFWRMRNGWPEPVGKYSTIEVFLAKVVHWVLIIGTVLMPVSGMLMSGGGGHGLYVFGFELLASNPDPANAEQVLPLNETLSGVGHFIHGTLANIMIAAIVLHIVGAVKHHVIDKDGTLRRMLGSSV